MNKNELKAVLNQFSSTACMQLKYYVIKSLFPNIEINEIKEIGNFNANTFKSIREAVESKELMPLCCENREVNQGDVNEELQNELRSLREELQTLQRAYDELQAGALAELDAHITQQAEDKKRIAALEDLARGLKIKLDYVQGKGRGVVVKDSADWSDLEI